MTNPIPTETQLQSDDVTDVQHATSTDTPAVSADSETKTGVEEPYPERTTPQCVALFDILGVEWTYLPYDVDAVYRNVVSELDRDRVDSVSDVQDMIADSVGIQIPDEAVIVANYRLGSDAYTSDSELLISLFAAHAVLIRDGRLSNDIREMVVERDSREHQEINRTFITVSVLRDRTHKTLTHFTQTLKTRFTESKQSAKSILS